MGSCLCFPKYEDPYLNEKKVCDIKCENEYFVIDSSECKCVKVPEIVEYPIYEESWIIEPDYDDYHLIPEEREEKRKFKKPECIPIIQRCF